MKEFAANKQAVNDFSPAAENKASKEKLVAKSQIGGGGPMFAPDLIIAAQMGDEEALDAVYAAGPGAVALLYEDGAQGNGWMGGFVAPKPLPSNYAGQFKSSTGINVSDVTITENPKLEENGKRGIAIEGRYVEVASGCLEDTELVYHELVHIGQQRQSVRSIQNQKQETLNKFADVEKEAIQGGRDISSGKNFCISLSSNENELFYDVMNIDIEGTKKTARVSENGNIVIPQEHPVYGAFASQIGYATPDLIDQSINALKSVNSAMILSKNSNLSLKLESESSHQNLVAFEPLPNPDVESPLGVGPEGKLITWSDCKRAANSATGTDRFQAGDGEGQKRIVYFKNELEKLAGVPVVPKGKTQLTIEIQRMQVMVDLFAGSDTCFPKEEAGLLRELFPQVMAEQANIVEKYSELEEQDEYLKKLFSENISTEKDLDTKWSQKTLLLTGGSIDREKKLSQLDGEIEELEKDQEEIEYHELKTEKTKQNINQQIYDANKALVDLYTELYELTKDCHKGKARDESNKTHGLNEYANPELTESYTMVVDRAEPVRDENNEIQGGAWNFHVASVIMKSGGDNVTFENFDNPDQIKNSAWMMQMYGTKEEKPHQTFHQQHQKTGANGVNPSTFRVRE